jgi:hypothetical protein
MPRSAIPSKSPTLDLMAGMGLYLETVTDRSSYATSRPDPDCNLFVVLRRRSERLASL